MTIGKYLKDKLLLLLLNGICGTLLAFYLVAVGNSFVTISLILIVWGGICFCVFLVSYQSRKRYFKKIEGLMTGLEQPYLVHELLDPSWKLEDQLYRDFLRQSNRAAMEQISSLRQEQADYRSFIEGWIHEVKLPITGMRLAFHNDKQIEAGRVERYLTEIDNRVEQVLFYGKSENVYKDFQVHKINLKEVIHSVLRKNKYLLIASQVSATVSVEECFIYSDKKWLEFILVQLIANAVKYKKDGSGEMSFHVEESNAETTLVIRDQGIGIKTEEIDRIFNKGFTGTNGRTREKSTGFGLYLCKKLCDKLNIGIGARSILGESTDIFFIFPKNNYLSNL